MRTYASFEEVQELLAAQGSEQITVAVLEEHTRLLDDYMVGGEAFPCLGLPNEARWFFDKDRRPPAKSGKGPMKTKAPPGARNFLGDLRSPSLVMLEGERDWLAALSVGVAGAVCVGGVQNLEAPQIKILADHGDVTFLFDNDEAGRTASQGMARKVVLAGGKAKVADLPEEGQDFDEWLGTLSKDEARVTTIVAEVQTLLRSASKVTKAQAKRDRTPAEREEEEGPRDSDEFIALNGDPITLIWEPFNRAMPHDENPNGQMKFAHFDRAASERSGFPVIHIVDEFIDAPFAEAPAESGPASMYEPPPVLSTEARGAVVRPMGGETFWRRIAVLPSGVGEYGSSELLFDELIQFIDDYFVVEPAFIKAMAAYVLMTYRFIDAGMESVPYIRVLGPAGAGKTRFSRVMRELCYRAVFVTGMRPPHVYRLLTSLNGHCTMVLEEFNIRDGSADSLEFVNMLNAGNQRGVYVPRMGGRNFDEVQYFPVFCPKVLGMTTEFSNEGLIRRCITAKLGGLKVPETKRYPAGLPPEFYVRAAALREKLVYWRFSKFGMLQPELIEDIAKDAPSEGVWQNWYPVLGMVPRSRPQIASEILALSKEHGAQLKQSREIGREARVLEACLAVDHVSEKPYTDLIIAELNSNDPAARWTMHDVHTIVRSLRVTLKRTRRASANVWYVSIDEPAFKRACEDFDIDPDAAAADAGTREAAGVL